MKRIRIGTKLFIAFSSIIVFTAILGIYSLLELNTLNKNGNIIYEKTTIPMGLLVKTTSIEQEMRLQVREWKIGKTDEARQAAIRILDEDYAVLSKLITEQKERSIQEEVKSLLDSLITIASKYVEEAHEYMNSNPVRLSCGMTEADIPRSLLEAGKDLSKAVVTVIELETIAANEISGKNSQIARRAIRFTLIILILAGVVSIGLSVHLTLHITRALRTVVNTVFKIEKGDTTARSNLKLKDEFGKLSRSVDSLALNMQDIMKGLRMDSDGLASSAEELSAVSNQLVHIAQDSLSQSHTVTDTTDRVLANINTMAKDAEKASLNSETVAMEMELVSANVKDMTSAVKNASNNIGSVAVTTRQMSANMNFIVNSVKDMKSSFDMMTGRARETRKVMEDAASRSREVKRALANLDNVVKEIDSNSNANANANAAGYHIRGIQVNTSEAISAMSKVSNILVRINESMESIFSLGSQQALASNEIVKNVEQADEGTKRVAEYMGQLARNSKDVTDNVSQIDISVERISRSINEVANSSKSIAISANIASKGGKLISYNATDMNTASNSSVQVAKQVSKNANELARIASDIKRVVDQFAV
ncbi:MAG: methyl-accepting chemotaxis protein [Fibromonadaceae bacterium]|nr:methyl-accepting chemotaxis protein [Fibromonadaceae bacterium]